MRIVAGDFNNPQVRALLEYHVATARAETAAASAHAFELESMKAPDINFWAAWDGDVLLGVGALKRLSNDHGEIKSMHTVQARRRKGVGTAMLLHIGRIGHPQNHIRSSSCGPRRSRFDRVHGEMQRESFSLCRCRLI
jgi:putative acetyltransferase